MATFTADDLNYKPVHHSVIGNTFTYSGSVTPTAGASGDIYRTLKMPAGFKPHLVRIKNADLDSNGSPTIACKVGYSYVDGSSAPSGADTAFAAAGQTFLQSATAAGAGTQFFVKPFELAKDAYLDIVLTANAATFASGEITVCVVGEGVGAK
jgi:hypothetical protein